jgi:hypothetical protein
MIRFIAVAVLLLATLLAGIGALGSWDRHGGDQVLIWIAGGLAALTAAATLSKDETSGMKWAGCIFFLVAALGVSVTVMGRYLRSSEPVVRALHPTRVLENASQEQIPLPQLSGKITIDAALLTMPPAERERTLDGIEAEVLGRQYGFDTVAAEKAGYSAQEIIKEIAKRAATDPLSRPAFQ